MSQEQIELWKSAADAFDARHQLVQDAHLELGTVCEEFNVAALIEHAVGTQVGIGGIFGSAAQEGDAWAEARAGMAEALSTPGAADGTMEHPTMGEIPRARMLAIATNDLLIHAWDLSRALGVDDALPEQNLQPAIEGVEGFPPALREQFFGTPLDVSDDAPLQTKMLAVAGRQA